MSLDFDNWVYEGPQWDNVPNVVPFMFKNSEKILRNVTQWIKQYKLDQKFDGVQKQIDQSNQKIKEIESDFKDLLKIMEQKTSQQFQEVNIKLQQQEETIKSLEQKLKMKDFQVEQDIEIKDEYNQLNKVYSKYFGQKKQNQISSQKIETSDAQKKDQRKNSIAKNTPIDLKTNSKRSSVTNSQKEISLSEKNNNCKDSVENKWQIEDETYQYENQFIIWKMINAALSESHFNIEINRIKEIIELHQQQLKTEIDSTKVQLSTNNNLISQVDVTIQEVQKMNENKFDKIFSYNLDKFGDQLQRGLQDIEFLQQSKFLIETLDSKYDEKCNTLNTEITQTNRKIEELKPPIEAQFVQIQKVMDEAQKGNEVCKTQLNFKINELSKQLNDKIATNIEDVNIKIDNCSKECSSQIELQNNNIKTNTANFNKNVSTFRNDIIADLEKLENGLADIFPRIKEFQTIVLEIQKQLIDIAEMEHIKFNENLQQKMSVFITNIWKKADKTEVALEKLIDSFLDYNQQQMSLMNTDLLQLSQNQQLSPKGMDRVNSQTLGNIDNLLNLKKVQQKDQSMDEGEEFNDNLEENSSSNYPLKRLKSLNQQNNKNFHTQESQIQESPIPPKRPYLRLEKDQIKLKKIQYTNACKEHNISFTKALDLDSQINGVRQNHSSQKTKRALVSQGQTSSVNNNLISAKGSAIIQQSHEKINKNPINEYSQLQSIHIQNKKIDSSNILKPTFNRFYENRDQANLSQHSENQELIFNQFNRIGSSQNRKRATSQNRTKIASNSFAVFNSNCTQLNDSHHFEITSGQNTNVNSTNNQQNIGSTNLEPFIDQQQSPVINPVNRFQHHKRKEHEINLQKNLLDIKLRILKKVKQNTEQEQYFTDNHFSNNQSIPSQK
ncbi:hypothetical protein ABPG72_016070 [Tetrahymena utriculariae]